MEEGIKRWTAKRKSTLVMEVIQGKTTVSEASRLDINGQYERQLKDLQKAHGDPGAAWPKKAASPVGRGREFILHVQQGLPSIATALNARRLSDLCRVSAGPHGRQRLGARFCWAVTNR